MPNAAGLTDAEVHKELDMIQDVIKRMATNSFQVKTWMMGIVTAILAFKHEEIFSGGKSCGNNGLWISLVLLFPVIMFWYLDAFFMHTEKLYRELFKWVVANRPFTIKYLYDLNTFTREKFTPDPISPVGDMLAKTPGRFAVMFSITLRWFYLIPFILVLAMVLYNLNL